MLVRYNKCKFTCPTNIGPLNLELLRRNIENAMRQPLMSGRKLSHCDVDPFTMDALCALLGVEPTRANGLTFVKFDGIEFHQRNPEQYSFTMFAEQSTIDKPGEAQTTGAPTFAA